MSNFIDGTGLGTLRDWVLGKLGTKQDTLISGTNIKTVNNNSLLGSGNVSIQTGVIRVDLTAAQYAALTVKDPNTLYVVD